MIRNIARVVVVALLLDASAGLAVNQSKRPRDSGESDAAAAYERGMELLKENRYREALESFEKAHGEKETEPEYLNMVAYTQRKLGRLEDAFETYHRVLALAPTFAPAREYLGEAHLQAALHQLDALRDYGDRASDEYERLVAAFRESAETLTAKAADGRDGAPDRKPW